MKKFKFLCIVLVVSCITWGCSSLSNRSERLDYEDKIYETLESHGFVGSVLVADSEGIIYEKSFGDDDITTGYEIGTLTAQFTAAAITMLEKEGRLNLDDNLGKYFTNAGWMGEYSIRDLINMNTRIPDYIDKTDFTVVTDKNMLTNEIFSYQPAGEITGNSSSNYYLLGLIIEQVSTMTYEEYVNKYVIQPMGFKNTVVNKNDYKSFATQGVCSNVYDMYHWNNAFFGGEILSEKSQADLESGEYEWMCGLNLKNGAYYGGNQTQMYSSHMMYGEGVYVIMLTNKFNPAIVSYAEEVYELTTKYIEQVLIDTKLTKQI